MRVMIDIPDYVYRGLKKYVEETDICTSTDYAIATGIPIPDNATNAEALRALFSGIEITDSEGNWPDEIYKVPRKTKRIKEVKQ